MPELKNAAPTSSSLQKLIFSWLAGVTKEESPEPRLHQHLARFVVSARRWMQEGHSRPSCLKQALPTCWQDGGSLMVFGGGYKKAGEGLLPDSVAIGGVMVLNLDLD